MRKSFILPLALSILIPLSASADQFGMLYGFMTTPSGATKVYSSGDDIKLETHKPTTGMFLGLENLRIGYLDYQLIASDSGSSSQSRKVVGVQVLTFEYQEVFPGGGFYHVGLGNFSSQLDYFYNTYGLSDDYVLHARGTANKQFDPGLIGGGGMQFEYGKGFLGAEFMMILGKKMKYEYADGFITSISISHLDEDIDVGVTILGIFAGVNF